MFDKFKKLDEERNNEGQNTAEKSENVEEKIILEKLFMKRLQAKNRILESYAKTMKKHLIQTTITQRRRTNFTIRPVATSKHGRNAGTKSQRRSRIQETQDKENLKHEIPEPKQ
jgi:hypothetical protein